jgi:hypothetical protein
LRIDGFPVFSKRLDDFSAKSQAKPICSNDGVNMIRGRAEASQLSALRQKITRRSLAEKPRKMLPGQAIRSSAAKYSTNRIACGKQAISRRHVLQEHLAREIAA